jgi:hypothetical protein
VSYRTDYSLVAYFTFLWIQEYRSVSISASRGKILHKFEISSFQIHIHEHLIYQWLLFKIPKKAPSAVTAPTLNKPVIQRRWKLINDSFEASVMREDDQNVFKHIKSLQADNSLLRLISVVAVGGEACISLDLEKGLCPVVRVGF